MRGRDRIPAWRPGARAAPGRGPAGTEGRGDEVLGWSDTGSYAQYALAPAAVPAPKAAQAQQASDAGHNRGKIVLTVN
ncbi:hypothetical protein C5F59_037830 [Streptomyces sp. QL37]|uniref:hypothetical protein n=1 Tax=Streptomyces sp. QL37 TaxID=2093747 RepID=UPI000CF26D14|nr:hypothetical protein [Streptomyces sp. QL37]PPQ61881.1 hypothetical protein C5F59_38340 [Streptomyces sp. QL37]